MGVLDDIGHSINHLLHGDLGAAVSDAGRAVGEALGGGAPAPTQGSIDNSAHLAAAEAILAANLKAKQAADPLASAPKPCCDRYRFDSGFLIDGMIGSVWKYDDQKKSFEEIPVNRSPPKQVLVNTLVESKLAALRAQYEQEVLSTTPPKLRQQKLDEFDKEQLAPLREAAKTVQF